MGGAWLSGDILRSNIAKLFVTVAREKYLMRAAKKLNVSQPVANTYIKALDNELWRRLTTLYID